MGSPAAAQRLDPNLMLGIGMEVMRQMNRGQVAPAPQQQQPRAAAPVVRQPAPAPILRQPPPPAYPAAQVAEIQRLLTELGFDPGPIDGDMGPRTAQAIRSFESLAGLSPTGVPSETVVGQLRAQRTMFGAAGPVAGGAALGFAPAVPGLAAAVPGLAPAPAPAAAPAPSFDCGRAGTGAETTICGSHALADLDVALSAAYAGRLVTLGGAERAALLTEQTAWLAQRDSCGGDAACLDALMRARIATLGGQPPAAVAAPVSAGGAVPGAISAGPSGPMAPQPTASFGQAGIRSLSPVMQDGRLVVGHQLRMLERTGPKTPFGRYEQSKATVDLALHVDLALLRRWPELLDDSETARQYAQRLLLGPTLATYQVECQGCSTSGPFPGWQGANEFEREAMYRGFVDTIGPLLTAAGAELPLTLRTVHEAELMAYDYERGVFPLRFAYGIGGPLFGSVNLGSRAQLTDATVYPHELTLDRAAAQAFLAALPQGEKRLVYLVVDQTLEPGLWNYTFRAPELSLVTERMAVYADPAGGRLLHEFPPAAPEEVAPGVPPPGMVEAQVPYPALIVKLAPDALDDATVLAMTRHQIQMDQNSIAQAQQGYDHDPTVFTAEEIGGRVIDFVAPDLAGEYRKRLALALEQVPLRLSLDQRISLQQVGYGDGALRAKGWSEDQPLQDWLFQDQGNTQPTEGLPDVGDRGLFSGPGLNGMLPEHGLPVSLSKAGIHNVYLAVDGDLTVPPIPMDAALAEAMWRPPDCAASQEALWSGDRSTMSPEQVEAISQQVEACRELANRYTGSLDARFDLEIESVEPFQGGWSEPAWIVKARLIGTRVSGPMGEELARFSPDQLPLPTGADVPEAAAAMVAIAAPPAPVAAAEPGTVPAAAVEPGAAGAEKLTSDGGEVVQAAATAGAAPVAEVVPDAELAARLAAADVGGVRLGMSLAEAEAAIRSAIEVAQVAALSEEAKEEARRAVAQWTPGVEPPYLEYRAYVGSDPGQAFVVFSHAAQRDAVLAVLRQVTVKGADVREALLAQLVERLGPALEGREQPDDPHVWTAHPGEVDAAAGWTPDMAFGSGTCRVDVGSGRADQIIEGGAEHPLRIRALSYSGKDLADPRRWRSCGPTVIAELRYDYDAGTVLTYALMDHAAYAPVYEAMVEAQKPAPVAIPKLWQD